MLGLCGVQKLNFTKLHVHGTTVHHYGNNMFEHTIFTYTSVVILAMCGHGVRHKTGCLSIITHNLKECNRVVTKISSCRVNTISRWGIKQLGISFGSIFLLFSNKSSRGPHS